MKKILVLIFLICFGTLGGNYFTEYNSLKNETLVTPVIGNEEVLIEVESGDTYGNLWKKLGIENEFLYKFYIRNNPPTYELQKGVYSISSASLEDIIQNQFQKPLSKDEQITILEGWNIYDIDIYLSEKGLIEKGDFIKYVTNTQDIEPLQEKYSFLGKTKTLEGFLYPDTYNINPNTFNTEVLVEKMLKNFHVKVFNSGIIDINTPSAKIKQILNLASIVQKEANIKDNPEELAIIAGILKKRLDEGWQIGADATVCYAHDIATQNCTPSVVLKYLYDKNNYNTRAMTGLPDGPIANPEAKVIKATANPTSTEYYYYLHDTNGNIHYGRNNNEHLENKRLYIK